MRRTAVSAITTTTCLLLLVEGPRTTFGFVLGILNCRTGKHYQLSHEIAHDHKAAAGRAFMEPLVLCGTEEHVSGQGQCTRSGNGWALRAVYEAGMDVLGGGALEDSEQLDRRPAPRQQKPSRSPPLVDARQLSPEEVRRRWPDSNFDVPDRMAEALKIFFKQPTPRLIAVGVAMVAAMRLSCGVALGVTDAVAVPAVALGWSFQEWAIHKYLLHGFENWLGYDVHEIHHDKPFYHVCVDPPDLVLGWTVAAASIFWILFPHPLALTVLAVYMVMGGVYEWTHYIVHTRVVPKSALGKKLKRHHTLHHLKDDSCWLAFTAPPIDHLLGTVPAPENPPRFPPRNS